MKDKFEYLSENLTENKITHGGFEYRLIQDNENNYLYISFVDLENKEIRVINKGHHPYLILEPNILENYDLIKKYIDDSIEIENQKLNKDDKIPPLGSIKLKILIRSLFKPITFNIDSNIQEDIRTNFEKAIEKRRIYNIDKKTIKKYNIDKKTIKKSEIVKKVFEILSKKEFASFKEIEKELQFLTIEQIKNAIKFEDGIFINNEEEIMSLKKEWAKLLYDFKKGPAHSSVIEEIMRRKGFVKDIETKVFYRFNKERKCYIECKNTEIDNFIQKEVNTHLKKIDKYASVSRHTQTLALNTFKVYKKVDRNILVFTNGYYNTSTNEFIKGEFTESIPYYVFDFEYNSKIKYGKNFNTYWNNYEEELQTKLLELIGYMLIKGNPDNLIVFIVGLGGSGKSTFINIIQYCLGKVSHVPLSQITEGEFGKFGLLGANVNISNDEENYTVKSNAALKQVSGGDVIYINVKFKNPVELQGEAVPLLCIVCNNIPKFDKLEEAVKRRLGIIELNTKEVIPHDEKDGRLLDKILKEKESLEWLIYNSLEAVKKITDVENKYEPEWYMRAKSDAELNDILGKASSPIRYFLEKGFNFLCSEEYDPNKEIDLYDYGTNRDYITSNEMQTFLDTCSEKYKQQITERRPNGSIKPRTICGYISDIAEMDKYKRKQKKIPCEEGTKNERVYWGLIPTEYYNKVMNKKV